jgi:hypothetical protein
LAFTDELVLDDADGTDVTYRLRSRDLNGSQRIDISTNAQNPGLLAIRHSSTGKGLDAVDRHLVSLTRTLTDTVGKQVTLTVNFTMAVPRNSVITNQIVYDAVGNILDLLTDGALTAGLSDTDAIASLLRGES